MKNKTTKILNHVVTDVIDVIARRNPSALSKRTKDGVTIGDVVAKKNENGVSIFKDGVKLYTDLKNVEAIIGIVNRLISNKKLHDIPVILKLEDRYVKYRNDLIFLKHSYKDPKKDIRDKDILQHRMIVVFDNIEEINNKLSTYKII